MHLQYAHSLLLIESQPLTGSDDNSPVGVIVGPVVAVVATLVVAAAVILYSRRVK